jgi:hypothetical protein
MKDDNDDAYMCSRSLDHRWSYIGTDVFDVSYRLLLPSHRAHGFRSRVQFSVTTYRAATWYGSKKRQNDPVSPRGASLISHPVLPYEIVDA